MNKSSLLFFFYFLLASCSAVRELTYNPDLTPKAPDYQNNKYWAALPNMEDQADLSPNSRLPNNQENAKVDVFYVHPTTLTEKRKKSQWNASFEDAKLNKKTDDSAIKYQASSMNGAGKVYAPRYRQAHLNAYYTKDTLSALKAFDLAYSDVKTAFEYYLKHYNNGRPFIIAAHSQGAQHSERFIKELIDGTPLQDKLVVAYLVGMPIKKNSFTNVKVCELPDETQCFCSWRSYKRGYIPPYHKDGEEIAVTNPLSWTTTTERIDKSFNQGAVLKNFNKVLTARADAEIHDGLLWMDKPRFPWSFLFLTPNYHIGDINLFYVNLRNNAILRSKSYLRNR